ncbi:MAG: hypothetical protein H0X72_01135 [Acidobacteria bacterium]|jgi:hypothetical protein|nr:hypothetical protein [Acidobacteriota bacterium]
MKANNLISKNEHKLLLIVSFIAFLFVLSIFTLQVIKDYNYSVSEKQQEIKNQVSGKPSPRFSSSAGGHTIPGLHFLTLFIFLALLKTKKFLLSSLLTVFYVFCIIYGLWLNISQFDEHITKVSFVEQLSLVANTFDYLGFFLASVLLFWQISILLRMLIKTLQRKIELP